jgi:hypothetical protein
MCGYDGIEEGEEGEDERSVLCTWNGIAVILDDERKGM